MINKKTIQVLMVGIFFCGALLGCSQTVKPGNYDSAEVGKVKKVASGTIVSMRPVNIRNKADANGVDTPNNENNLMPSHGFEYVVRLANGAIISMVQTEDSQLKLRQHVLVIYGENTRIVPDNGSED